MFDITPILQGLLILLIGLITYKLWPAFQAAVPAIVVKFVKLVARFAVYAVEADFGSGNGSAKFDAALDMVQRWFNKFGLTYDTTVIKNAILDEWYKLNRDQIVTGIKCLSNEDVSQSYQESDE